MSIPQIHIIVTEKIVVGKFAAPISISRLGAVGQPDVQARLGLVLF